MSPGGLWDKACQLYIPLGATKSRNTLTFQSGAKIQFNHMEREENIYDWQGSEIPFMGFDELTHFTEKQFFYMLSRNRGTCGVKPYIRATTNPDPDSWVAEFISWWINPETGLPIPERDGVVRWFRRVNNIIEWSDTKETEFHKSVTFISSKLEDNPILMENDPGYLANLEAMSLVDRERLRGGNWKIREASGTMFQRGWFHMVEAVPAGGQIIRYWDRAGTKKKHSAYTAGVKMKLVDNTVYILHVERFKGTPGEVESQIKNIAIQDGKDVWVGIEQDPGQAGIFEANSYVKSLIGFVVKIHRAASDKVTRAKPLSAQCEHGNVKILRGNWNEVFIDECENFPDATLKDQVDAASGAFNVLTEANVGSYPDQETGHDSGTIAGAIMRGEDQW